MSKKTPASRFAEVFLSMGIPAIGYIRTAEHIDWKSLCWQIPVILLAAWHIIIINDNSFGKNISIKTTFFSEKNITGGILFPFLILPSIYISPLFGLLIFITIINWDIYSLKGKRNWIAGLLHNFIGGALHFMIGISCAFNRDMGVFNIEDIRSIFIFWPEILFFAFAMTSGAMHHDSFDTEEDRQYGYITGAVKFSSERWWRLAAVPFLAATGCLIFTEPIFRISFIVSSIAYFSTYTTLSLKKRPTSSREFRSICRLSFIGGALLYLYFNVS